MSESFVRVGGLDVFIITAGMGVPSAATAVLIPGVGGTAFSWAAVIRLLSPHIRTFTYDHLGLGNSSATSVPRPAATLAEELHETLLAASIPGPYILVASSYGGIIGREFLEAHDELVAGLVYVDANHERAAEERRWPLDATVAMGRGLDHHDAIGLSGSHKLTSEEWSTLKSIAIERKEHHAAGVAAEEAHWGTSLAALGRHNQLERRLLGSRPLSVIQANLVRDFRRVYEAGVLAGNGTALERAAVEDFLQRLPAVELRLNSDMLRLSSVHRLLVTSESGHEVMMWEPEVVAHEVLWALDKVKSG